MNDLFRLFAKCVLYGIVLFEDLDWLLGFIFVGLIVVNILGSSLVFLSCRDGFFVSLCFGMKILFIHNKIYI